MLFLACKLSYIRPASQQELLDELDEVLKLLTAFRTKIVAS